MLSCSLAAADTLASEPLRIGVVGDMSDRNPTAMATVKAVSFAVEDIRKAGLLTGDVSIISRDDQCKSDVATYIARSFSDQDRVNLVVGHTCTITSIPASNIYREKNILQIDPATTHPGLTEGMRGKKSRLFRLAERQDRAAAVAVVVLKDQIANKNVCLVGGAFSKSWLDRFQALATGTSRQFSVAASLPERGSGADLCIVYDPDDRTGLRGLGNRDDVIGAIGLDDRLPNPSTNIDQVRDLTKRLRAAGYSGPISIAVNAYAAVQVWAVAMKEAGSAEPDKVAEQMHRLKFETIRGLVAFDEIGDVRQPLITLVRYSNPIIEVPNKCNEAPCKDCKCSECCPK
ncbi:branched-chain amino acid ABC transporter substrate-binding protein [Bradyrhizobium sp. SRS-191]|uniref:branched-chain amino acid ABC transporter substrate-binding protein n=1 Tax=Bradyrhizobium sp. SRS-191 TaxID=2962606 RepID=UPI00211E3527|nr:branched-chain amino acid ABC transporter substrate-binding protein [Bradyrhizobium sp. SRS-191]